MSPYGRALAAADAVVLRRLKRSEREAWELQRPASVAVLTTETLLRRLRDLGIDGSRESFLARAEGRTSAWEVSEEWTAQLVLDRPTEVFAGLAAHQLWKRFCPERPTIEQLEDLMREGHALDFEGDVGAACEVWVRAWAMLRAWLRPEHRRCSDADSIARAGTPLEVWFQDLGLASAQAAGEDPALAATCAQCLEQILEQFPDEDDLFKLDLRGDLAEVLEGSGQPERAEGLLREVIREHPGSGAGYVRLAEILEGRGDRPAALAILRDAQARLTDESEDWDVDDRIERLERPSRDGVNGGHDGPICDRPGCFDPPRAGSRFCGSECEYAMSEVEQRERRHRGR